MKFEFAFKFFMKRSKIIQVQFTFTCTGVYEMKRVHNDGYENKERWKEKKKKSVLKLLIRITFNSIETPTKV